MENQPSTDDQFLKIVYQSFINIVGNENFSTEYLVLKSGLIWNYVSSNSNFSNFNHKVLNILLLIFVQSTRLFLFLAVYRLSEKSTAVLPLNNLKGKTKNNHLTDALHEALLVK